MFNKHNSSSVVYLVVLKWLSIPLRYHNKHSWIMFTPMELCLLAVKVSTNIDERIYQRVWRILTYTIGAYIAKQMHAKNTTVFKI